MKRGIITAKRVIIALIGLSVLFFIGWNVFVSMIAIEPDSRLVFIKGSTKAERTKAEIYFAAKDCGDTYFQMLADTEYSPSYNYSKYTIKYGDDIFTPLSIDVYKDENAKIVMAAFNRNTAKRNRILEAIEHFKLNNVRYQQENVGILYCNDDDFLSAYLTRHYYSGFEYITVIPIKENIYWFAEIKFVYV